jgi:hypothetical protein
MASPNWNTRRDGISNSCRPPNIQRRTHHRSMRIGDRESPPR